MNKTQYQPNSPYIDLLYSKKKAYGIGNQSKSTKNHWRNSPGSTSLFSQMKKHFKSQSCQKARTAKSQQTKKKRVNTQAQQKLHQSLCVNMDQKNHQTHHATKSLFYAQHNQSKHQREDSTNKFNSLFPKPIYKKNSYHYDSKITQLGGLQNLNINDIDSLVNLIDQCVIEANQYISYLSQKLQVAKQQINQLKCINLNLHNEMKLKIQQNDKKDRLVKALSEQVNLYKMKTQQPYQLKKLLQVIQKMSEQNEILKKSLQNARKINTTKSSEPQDFYKEIHNKIDILNISIDNKNSEQIPDERSKTDPKRYKFIKQKLK